MRKALAILVSLAALELGGCAGTLPKLENAWTVLNQTTVPPQYALVAANAYDAIEAGATQYLVYCKSNLSAPICSAADRRAVIKNVRAGRSLRNQVEGYVNTQTAVPVALYQGLEDIITILNTSPASTFGATK